jgi:hypothetical protein
VAPRLKVFVTSDGLTDYVVATSSKAKALAAWGVHQDLFKTGAAKETDDPALVEAALAKPGEVLRRPAGSRAALAKLRPAKPARPAKEKKPSAAALKRVADLEARLASLREAHAQTIAEIARAREELDAREALCQRNFDAQSGKLEGDLVKARKALNA